MKYDLCYVAKRMELGAVIAAAPKKNVVRETPAPGDVVILLGGKTGRDGCGGATGSSKAHTEDSLEECGAEVQKGNPVEERKIQRLFRKPHVTTLIKRCNDFGAGGVSVAIGELADGLLIDLDKVPTKYEGLDGTEIAISESQERMAVVVAKSDCEKLIKEAQAENLEATEVAKVTEEKRLVMHWRGKKIVDISREFLNTNGAPKKTNAKINKINKENLNKCINVEGESLEDKWLSVLSDLNICSKKGIADRFDSTVGASTVFMPYGGAYQQTPMESMVSKIPVLDGETKTGTVMAHGFNPYLSEKSTFHGGTYAIVEAVSKVVAAGAKYEDCFLSLQEYFESPKTDPLRWGKPLGALLGAYYAQKGLKIGAIGGKDSMSGTFNDIDVPPTIVAFAVADLNTDFAVSNEFKESGSNIYIIEAKKDENYLPIFEELCKNFSFINSLINERKVLSAHTVGAGGICEAISKMSFGNMIGAEISAESLFDADFGSIIIETNEEITYSNARLLGKTITNRKIIVNNVEVDLERAINVWRKPLSKIFPESVGEMTKVENITSDKSRFTFAKESFAKPRVFIPIFPGTTGEYESERAFKNAGAQVEAFVIRNSDADTVTESIDKMKEIMDLSQIIMIPGGFSGDDEPTGLDKFVLAAFRNPKIEESIMNLLYKRDGLMLGISAGFRALISLGLVPYGEIRDMDEDGPALTFNDIGRHMSSIANTRICSKMSPWLSGVSIGDIHSVAISYNKGKFVATKAAIENLMENGQIATQYVDLNGNATMQMPYNPTGSYMAVEGITSPDGRVLGKMGHSERIGKNVYKNIPGDKDQRIFESGVKYFKY